MNRKQEIALWVFGMLLALVSAYNGAERGDWFFNAFMPTTIVGALVFMALRTRRSASSQTPVNMGVVLALVASASVFGYFRELVENAATRAEAASESDGNETRNELDGKLDEVRDDLETEIRQACER